MSRDDLMQTASHVDNYFRTLPNMCAGGWVADEVGTRIQSMKPIVSSMIAAKLLVSRCFPLVIGGNCAILMRKSFDFNTAGDRLLNS